MIHYSHQMIYLIFKGLFWVLLTFHFVCADTLSSNYNLGKLPSTSMLENGFGWGLFGSSDISTNIFHLRTPTDHNTSFGITPLLFAISAESEVTYFHLIPEFDLTWQSPYSNRFYLSIQPMNLFFLQFGNGNGTSGFEIPLTILNHFEWDFLNRKGTITIDPSEYELAFLYKPLLNLGQFRNRLIITHTLNTDTIPYRRIGVTTLPEYGVFENFSFQMHGHYSYIDSVTGVSFRYSSYESEQKIYYKSVKDSFNIGCGLQYRNERMLCMAGAGFYHWKLSNNEYYRFSFEPQYNVSQYRIADLRFSLSAAYLLGKRILSGQEIEGNWDGSESKWLGKGQWLNEINAECIPSRGIHIQKTSQSFEYPPTTSQMSYDSLSFRFTLLQQSRLGLYKYLEVGENFTTSFEKERPSLNRLGFSITSCNIALRQYGPDQALDQEYYHGSNLRKNQYFLSLKWYPPVFKNKTDYSFLPIFERVLPFNMAMKITDPFASSLSKNKNASAYENSAAISPYSDLSISIAWAPTNVLMLSNQFEWGVFNFNPIIADNVQIINEPPHVVSNSVFSESFSIIWNVSSTSRVVLSTLYARQADTNRGWASDDEVKYFMLFFGYQAALPNIIQRQSATDITK